MGPFQTEVQCAGIVPVELDAGGLHQNAPDLLRPFRREYLQRHRIAYAVTGLGDVVLEEFRRIVDTAVNDAALGVYRIGVVGLVGTGQNDHVPLAVRRKLQGGDRPGNAASQYQCDGSDQDRGSGGTASIRSMESFARTLRSSGTSMTC